MSTITRAPAAALAPWETSVAAILAEGYLRLAVRQLAERAERAARDSQGATPSARESLRGGKALRVARRFTGSLSGAPAGSVGVLSEAEGARPRAFGAHRAMKQKTTKTVAAAGAVAALRRFRALRCGADGFVAMDGATEALTLTRCRGNGLLWATPIEPRYRALAAALNDAEVPFDRIVSSGEIEPASEGDYEVQR